MKMTAILAVIAVTALSACANDPEPVPAPEPITPEATYDKLGNRIS